jgi:hypothetical protein
MNTTIHTTDWMQHLRDFVTRWAHPLHAETIHNRDGIGAYAAAELSYPLAPEWPPAPLPRYIQARAQGMPIAALKLRTTAELAAVFNY